MSSTQLYPETLGTFESTNLKKGKKNQQLEFFRRNLNSLLSLMCKRTGYRTLENWLSILPERRSEHAAKTLMAKPGREEAWDTLCCTNRGLRFLLQNTD
jgi:hypothetical protein